LELGVVAELEMQVEEQTDQIQYFHPSQQLAVVEEAPVMELVPQGMVLMVVLAVVLLVVARLLQVPPEASTMVV
jgi:hypothetical protein